MNIMKQPHVHVWTTSGYGTEYANAVYEDPVDASIAFLGIAQGLAKYYDDIEEELKIETVYNSLSEGRGMWVGTPNFLIVMSNCSGNCYSATWN